MNGAGNGEGEPSSPVAVVVVEEGGNGEGEPSPVAVVDVVVEEGVVEKRVPASAGNGGNGGDRGGGLLAHAPNFGATEEDTLLVVATLITALTYQLGTNIPGGYWQADDGAGHVAGDPIMRDKHRRRYWLFMAASWAGFGTSMLLTVGLLTGVPAGSRLVRVAFLVAYSSLVLTFVTSQPRTSLAMDLGIWAAVMALLGVATTYLRLDKLPRWARSLLAAPAPPP